MNIIGYKGTEEERSNIWNALLFLRKSMDYYKEKGNREEALKKERKIYQEFFRDYVA